MDLCQDRVGSINEFEAALRLTATHQFDPAVRCSSLGGSIGTTVSDRRIRSCRGERAVDRRAACSISRRFAVTHGRQHPAPMTAGSGRRSPHDAQCVSVDGVEGRATSIGIGAVGDVGICGRIASKRQLTSGSKSRINSTRCCLNRLDSAGVTAAEGRTAS